MNKDWLITPFNEGQELNYCETFKGSYVQAEKRTKEMIAILKTAMPQGTISAMIENGKCTQTFYIN